MLQKSILGTLIINGLRTAEDYIPLLQGEYFGGTDRRVFNLIKEKVEKKEDFDGNLIAEEIKEKKWIEKPYSYLALLEEEAGPVSLLPIYIERVKKQITRLKSLDLLSNNGNLEQVLELLRKLEENPKEKVNRINEIMEDLNIAIKEGIGVEFKFKFTPLRKMLVGLDRGELTVIGGWTSQAKSSLCLQLAIEFAEQGYKVLFCSSEMTEPQIGKRIISLRCHINSMKFKSLDFTEEEKERIRNEISLINIPLWMNKISRVVEVRRVIRKLQPDIIFVDHIHQMIGPGRSEYEMISNIVVDLKNLAIEENVAIVAVSQLHRKEKESARRPKLSDLRSSGRIEENANNVILLYWSYPITGNEKKKNDMEIISAKSRDGRIGFDNDITFIPEYYEFTEKLISERGSTE